MFGNLITSVIRGGVIKGLAKKAATEVGKKVPQSVRGLKTVIPRVVKGSKQSVIRTTRGLKQQAGKIKALPKAISLGVKDSKALALLKPNLTLGGQAEFIMSSISQDLSRAGQRALSKDSAGRLSKRLAKGLKEAGPRRALQNMLKNARDNETIRGYAKRQSKAGVKTGLGWLKGMFQGAGENLIVDNVATTLGKALATTAVGGTAGAVGAGLTGKKKNKKK